MVFACQLDSFQRTLVSTVKSCEKSTQNGGAKDGGIYEVICDDTILFPEGGGQPCDTGYINGIPVQQVLRKGGEAIIYVNTPVQVGDKVEQKIDWERRFDHMQQHSGQHLITAIINAEYKIDTTAWWLGEKVCHIELNTTKFIEEQMANVELLVNQKILEQIPVKVKLYNIGDEALGNARTRGLPSDVSGPIRIVEIVGLEDDLCCGTHVTNLVQLQCIKLLYAEKGKKNKTNLFFVCGGRVMKYLSECLQREQKLIKLLKNEPASHADLVEKLQQSVKISNKKLATALKELAVYEAKKFKETTPQPLYFFHHNKDGDSDYLDSYLRTVKENSEVEDTLFMLTVGDDKGSGHLVLHGNPDIVKELGPKVAEILGGKGAAHGSKFQGKVLKMANLKKAEELIRSHFDQDNRV